MNEKELVIHARGGDRDAFNELISNYIDKIYRLGFKVSGNEEDAQDILQETFLKAIDKIESFRSEASFGTWLYSIAMNVMRGCFAQRKKMALKPIEDYAPDHSDTGSSGLFKWNDPHEMFENSQIQGIIDDFIAEMPEENSTPFILRYIEEMPVKEIAGVMGLSVSAVKSRILRARLALREHISSKMEEKMP
ncbi:MAG: sigma-70 family RNA polymerase sigma factor [Candidatus Krumholzibacteria bacterium]|nr:sigma-70 family RNA polymerase sigma factor [Candidatus Krumholzibacteria bacterium]